jgi:hypothetical protein
MHSGVVVLGLVLAAAGCGFHGPGEAGDSGASGDGCTSFATQFGLDTCQLGFDGDLTVTGLATYDSNSQRLAVGTMVIPVAVKSIMLAGAPVDAISARNVRVAGSSAIRAIGPRALVIAALETITVDSASQIDVSVGGAGAPTSCASAAMPGQDNAGGAGGGGGGGYGADGGDGGRGNVSTPIATGGPKGHALAAMPSSLRGGCPGAPGGVGASSTAGGLPGPGGGAMYLVAGDRISLGGDATLIAGGGGGGGGANDSGGGGGGAGGMIVLEAPEILGSMGEVAANGGGGGEGASAAQPGGAGAGGGNTTSRASGGTGMSDIGTDGGRGGSLEDVAGESVTLLLAGAGGGGGGGVGFIHIVSLAPPQLGSISPPPR